MNKNGYTLAELLITMGIIGVIVAIMGVAITNLRPDPLKAQYLKRYDALTATIKDAAKNSAIYPICYNFKNASNEDKAFNCQKYPLFNTNEGLGRNKIFANNNKICSVLQNTMTGSLENSHCAESLTYSGDNKVLTPSFSTQNNTDWLVITTSENQVLTGKEKSSYQTDIYIDINGDALPNCLYSSSCTEPDRFKFLVAADGTVLPADPLGKLFVAERTNLFKKSRNIDENETILADLPDELKKFTLNDFGTITNNKGGNSGGGGGGEEPGGEETGGKEPVGPGGDESGNTIFKLPNNGGYDIYYKIKCGDKAPDGRIVNCAKEYENVYNYDRDNKLYYDYPEMYAYKRWKLTAPSASYVTITSPIEILSFADENNNIMKKIDWGDFYPPDTSAKLYVDCTFNQNDTCTEGALGPYYKTTAGIIRNVREYYPTENQIKQKTRHVGDNWHFVPYRYKQKVKLYKKSEINPTFDATNIYVEILNGSISSNTQFNLPVYNAYLKANKKANDAEAFDKYWLSKDYNKDAVETIKEKASSFGNNEAQFEYCGGFVRVTPLVRTKQLSN